jgi:hypothetical protein
MEEPEVAATVAAGLPYTAVVGARFQPGRRRRARPGAEQLVDLTVQLNKLWGGTAALSHVLTGTTLPRHRRAGIGDEPVEELVELAFVDSHDESPVLVHLEDRIGHAVALALEPGCNKYRDNSEDGIPRGGGHACEVSRYRGLH